MIDIVKEILEAIEKDAVLTKAFTELCEDHPQIVEMARKKQEKDDKMKSMAEEKEAYYKYMESRYNE